AAVCMDVQKGQDHHIEGGRPERGNLFFHLLLIAVKPVRPDHITGHIFAAKIIRQPMVMSRRWPSRARPRRPKSGLACSRLLSRKKPNEPHVHQAVWASADGHERPP